MHLISQTLSPKFNPSSQNTSEKEISKQKERENIIFKALYTARKMIPVSNVYVVISICLKLIGLIVFSHTYKRGNGNSLILSTFFRNLCYFNDLSNVSTIFFMNYNTLCLLIFLVVIFPFLTFLIIYKVSSHKEEIIYSKLERILLKLSGAVFAFNFFFFQHFMEILYFIYLHVYILNVNTSTTHLASGISKDFQKLEKDLYINKYFFLLLNSIFILLANMSSFFYLKILNEPFFNSTSGFKFAESKFLPIFLLIISNFQGFHYFAFAFQENSYTEFISVLVSLAIAFSTLVSLNLFMTYSFKVIIIPIIHFVALECLLSCLIDIIIYNVNANNLTSEQLYLVLSIKLIIPLVVLIVAHSLKRKWNAKKMEENIFIKHKKNKKDVVFLMVQLIDECLNDAKNFMVLFNIIYKHQLGCKKGRMGSNLNNHDPQASMCSCQNFKFKKYNKILMQGNQLEGLIESEKRLRYIKLYEDFLILVQNEISTTIHQLSKNNENDGIDFSILVLYFDFIFFFKRNPNFSNFILEQCITVIKNIPFYYRFYLYVYKRKIFKFCKHKILNEKEKVNTNFYLFLNYLKTTEKIKRLVKDTSNDLYKIIQLQNEILNFKLNFNNRKLNAEGNEETEFVADFKTIYSTCRNLNKNYSTLVDILNTHYSHSFLKNPEVSFILNEFFHLIYKDIPYEISTNFQAIDSYGDILEFSTAYAEVKMHHPIIVSMEKMDLFSIKYISQKLCDMLNYRKGELINEDFNIFLPAQFKFEHKILIQKTIFMQNRNFYCRNTFLLTKDYYYYPVKMTSMFMPSITERMLLIIDINPKGYESSAGETLNEYHFVLDFETNFICISPNFEEKFGLSKDMLEKVNVNFSNLFEIELNKHSQKIKSIFNSIDNIDTENLDGMVKIFKQVNLDKALKIYKSMRKQDKMQDFDVIDKSRVLKFVRKKEKMLPALGKMRKVIEESELDEAWLNKVADLERNIYRRVSVNKLNDALFLGSSFSKKKTPDTSFNIKLSICNIGNLPYFYVTIYEQEERQKDLITGSNANLRSGRDRLYVSDNTPSNYNLMNRSSKKLTPSKSPVEKEDGKNLIVPKMNKVVSFKGVKILQNMDQLINKNTSMNACINASHSLAQDYMNLTMQTNTHNNISINDTHAQFFHSKLGSSSLFQKHTRDEGKVKETIVNTNMNNSQSVENYKRSQLKRLNKDNKKRNKNQKILYTVMVVFVLIFITITLVNFACKANKLVIGQNLGRAFFYGMATNAYIYFSSSLVALSCTKLDNIDPPEYTALNVTNAHLALLFKDYSSKLLYYFKSLTTALNSNDNISQDLINLYNEKESYRILFHDWTYFLRENSTFIDEMQYYIYYISKMQDVSNFNQCRVKDHFINENITTIPPFTYSTSGDSDVNNASFLESVFFYIETNVMQIFLNKLNKISILASTTLTTYLNDNKLFALSLYLVILLFAVLLILTFFFIFTNYKKKIKNLILQFYLDNQGSILLKKKIENLKEILHNFNFSDCEIYEHRKMEIVQLHQMTNSLVATISGNISNLVSANNTEGLNLDKQEMNDVNIVPADTQSIKSKVIKNKSGNKTKNKKILETEAENVIYTFEDFKLKMPITKIFYYFFFFSFCIYCVLIIIPSVSNMQSIQGMALSYMTMANFIERITKLSGLCLYFKISVIKDNADYLTTPKSEYDTNLFANYFNINENYSLDSIYSILGDSEFAYFYYEFDISRKNIDAFMSMTDVSLLLPSVRAYEIQMQSSLNPDFCYNLIVGDAQWMSKYTEDYLTGFKYLNDLMIQCKKFAGDMLKNELSELLNIMLSALKNLYSDFSQDKSDRSGTLQSKEAKVLKHLSTKEFIQIYDGVTIVFEKLMQNYFSLMKSDFESYNSYIIKMEYMSSMILLGFNFLFIIITISIFVFKYELYYTQIHTAMNKYTMATQS